jgi:hypothetical protein
MWIYITPLHTSSWRSAESVKHWDNFTFTYHFPVCKNTAQHNASESEFDYGNGRASEDAEVGLVIAWMGSQTRRAYV